MSMHQVYMAADLVKTKARYVLERYHKLRFVYKVCSLLFRPIQFDRTNPPLAGSVASGLVLHFTWSVPH